jgi:LacI family transcriptional regulator
MKSVTMIDIAKKAGISRKYVSGIINNNNSIWVSEATRERVLNIAKELKFQPNQFARSLKTGKTNCIGISTLTAGSSFLKQFNNPYLGSVYSGIGDQLGDSNIKLIFQEVNSRSESIDLAQTKMVDGLIFVLFAEAMDYFEQIKTEVLQYLKVPYVVIHSLQDDMGCNSIGLDCIKGGYRMVEHLLQHGYSSIGCVKDQGRIPFVENVYLGFQKALAGHNVPLDENMVFVTDGTDIQVGYRLAEQLLQEKHPLPRALFVLDDFICYGMIKKFQEAGVRVPEDIALVAFEDEYLELDNIFEVTALVQPGKEKGRQAAKLLLNLINSPEKYKELQQVILEPRLAIRKTCGCATKIN